MQVCLAYGSLIKESLYFFYKILFHEINISGFMFEILNWALAVNGNVAYPAPPTYHRPLLTPTHPLMGKQCFHPLSPTLWTLMSKEKALSTAPLPFLSTA